MTGSSTGFAAASGASMLMPEFLTDSLIGSFGSVAVASAGCVLIGCSVAGSAVVGGLAGVLAAGVRKTLRLSPASFLLLCSAGRDRFGCDLAGDEALSEAAFGWRRDGALSRALACASVTPSARRNRSSNPSREPLTL